MKSLKVQERTKKEFDSFMFFLQDEMGIRLSQDDVVYLMVRFYDPKKFDRDGAIRLLDKRKEK